MLDAISERVIISGMSRDNNYFPGGQKGPQLRHRPD